jgi:tRNA-dihydrouridine synthase A
MSSFYGSKGTLFILILLQVLVFPIAIMSFHSLSALPRRAPSRCRHFASVSKNSAAEDTKRRKNEELMDASKLSLAPMMEYTDRHLRHLVRLVSSKTLLYTEMVAANALSHERRAQLEGYMVQNPGSTLEQAKDNYDDQYLQRYLGQGRVAPLEGASVLQLGGSDPNQMIEAAETVMDLTDRGHCDYTAINLNCGCPSPKVAGKGCFGAALMDDPKLVSELTRALDEGCGGQLPITVKCRIGTDSNFRFTKDAYAELDPELEYRQLCEFVETVASNGIVTDFSVHARIAVLSKSFSPADNRKIPPLKHDLVNRLVQDYPEFTFSLNGGVDSIPQAQNAFANCPGLNGVMIGRSWAADPWSFAMADHLLYDVSYAPENRLQVLKEYGKHADAEEELWDPQKIRRFIVKAVTPLFTGEPNAKRYRIALDDIARLPKTLHAQGKTLAGQPPISELILNAAYDHLSEDVLLRAPQESYERVLYAESKKKNGVSNDRSEAIAEWHTERRKEEDQASIYN